MKNIVTRDDILMQNPIIPRQRTINIARRLTKRRRNILNAENRKFQFLPIFNSMRHIIVHTRVC